MQIEEKLVEFVSSNAPRRDGCPMSAPTKATSADIWRIVAAIAADLKEEAHTLQTGYLNRHTVRTPALGIDRGGRRRAWLWVGEVAHALELNAAALSDLGVGMSRRERVLAHAKELHACNPVGAWPVRKEDSTPIVLGPAGIEGPSGFFWPVGFRAIFETLQRTMPGCEVIQFSNTTIRGKGSSAGQRRSYVHVTGTDEHERLAILVPHFNGILRAYMAAPSTKMEKEDRLIVEAWARSLGISGADLVDAGFAMHTVGSFTDINQVRLR